MAKFSACYQICPLIDQKSFLGVSDESVNGCVIITLGKNMVIRYKLSDQKQVSSWSSRQKLSAPVMYDYIGCHYIGVFNENQIIVWNEDSNVELNKLEKFKFTSPIECVLSNESTSPVVVFRNGHVMELQYAINQRKTPLAKNPPLEKGEIIKDAQLVKLMGLVVVALFTRTHEGEDRLHQVSLEPGLQAPICLPLRRKDKAEDELRLIGHTLVCFQTTQLLTLWSDGTLYSLEMPISNSEQFPGQTLATLTAISPRHEAAILPLSPHHVAVYGAASSEEGAVLLIFNSQLGVTQCQQLLKLYSEPARLWAGGRDAVLLSSGQHLVVAPYTLGKQRLAALVGSVEGEVRSATIADWGQTEQGDDVKMNDSSHLQKMIQSCLDEGMSQRAVCESLLLPILDSKDMEGLTNILDLITDVPESCIITIITFCLKDISASGYRAVLRRVLSLHVTPDLTTLRLIRHRLPFGIALELVRELCDAMLTTPADPLLIEWATLLLDAHYQQYLLSKDENVVNVLDELKHLVDLQSEELKVWNELQPLLIQLIRRQAPSDPSHLANTTYSIDQITLY